MSYYHKKTLENISLKEAIARTRKALKQEGFGVLTEIDIRATMKEKLGADIPPYVILGACNPSFAYEALQKENKIGTLLPCNVIVQQTGDATMEVAAINPIVSMQAVENNELRQLAVEVDTRLQKALELL